MSHGNTIVTPDGQILVLEIKASPRPILTEDENNFVLENNAHILQNMGQHPVSINERFTILPGGSLQLGSSNDTNKVNVKWKVKFNTSVSIDNPVYSGNRLEVMDIETQFCDCHPCNNIVTKINGIKNG